MIGIVFEIAFTFSERTYSRQFSESWNIIVAVKSAALRTYHSVWHRLVSIAVVSL